MIRVVCPVCATSAKVSDSAVGRRAKCPKCQAVIRVPDISTAALAESPLLAAPAEAGRGRVVWAAGATAALFAMIAGGIVYAVRAKGQPDPLLTTDKPIANTTAATSPPAPAPVANAEPERAALVRRLSKLLESAAVEEDRLIDVDAAANRSAAAVETEDRRRDDATAADIGAKGRAAAAELAALARVLEKSGWEALTPKQRVKLLLCPTFADLAQRAADKAGEKDTQVLDAVRLSKKTWPPLDRETPRRLKNERDELARQVGATRAELRGMVAEMLSWYTIDSPR